MFTAKRKIIVLSVATALWGSGSAYAGLFDFFNSDSQDKKPVEIPAPEEKKPAPAVVQKKPEGVDKCGDPAAELTKTTSMSAKDLMGELRTIKSGFIGGNPMQSLNALFFGGVVNASAKGAASKTGSAAVNPMQALLGGLTPPAQKKDTGKPSTGKLSPGKSTSTTPPKAKTSDRDGCPSVADVQAIAGMASMLTTGMMPGSDILGGMASSLTDVLLDALISELSYTAIDTFLGQMLDNPKVLSEITVDVPDIASLSPGLRKQVLNLGGYLAAIKGSNLMVASAQGEFDAAKASYVKVMEIREKAAKALMEALVDTQALRAAVKDNKTRGSSGAEISEADLQHVEAMLGKGPEEFMKDPSVQQVAIAYLRSKKDRQGDIVDMESAQKEFRGHYGAYTRTATGAGSMVGFSSLFLKKSKQIFEQQGLIGGAALIPMIAQGAQEVGALALNVRKVFDALDEMNEGSFRIERSGEVVKRGISFKKAVGQLDEAALASLKLALIQDGGKGHLTNLYKKSSGDVARLADHTTGKAERKALAEAFEVADPELFTFQNMLAGKVSLDKKGHKRILGLFQVPLAAPGEKSDPEDKATWDVQQKLRDGVTSDYSNGDARRILFASGSMTQGISAGDYRIVVDSLGMEGLNDQMAYLTGMAAHATVRTPEKGDPVSKPVKRGKKI